MELSPKQEAVELIKKSKRIILLTPNLDGDSLGASIALFLTFSKMDKEAIIICPEDVPANLKFLPQIEVLKKDLSEIRNFIINLDLSKATVARLGYKTEDDKLKIIITPKNGCFTSRDISTSHEEDGADLIIVLDTPDLNMFGSLYDDNTSLFYQTPVLNIDHHASNKYFGKINLVDLTATSTCEVLISLLESLGAEQSIMDADIATALLTGLITDTSSFQNTNTTPKSFTVAAQLIAQGGRQQEIIKNVYKTRALSTLRLWGRILAQIREDKDYKIVWSLVSLRDLEQTNSAESEISGAIDELLTSAPMADVILLLSERECGIYGSIRTSPEIDATEIAKMFGGGGHSQAAAFQLLGYSLVSAEREVIEKIREFQKKRGVG